MPKRRNKVRTTLVARSLLEGKSGEQACKDAGYAVTTARKDAYIICNSPEVVEALREIGKLIKTDHLDEVSRARLMEALVDPSTDSRSLTGLISIAQKMAGNLETKPQQHDVFHHYPPEVIELLSARAAEILEERKAIPAEAVVVDAEPHESRETQAPNPQG